MSKTFQRADKSFFQEPKKLGNLISKMNLIHKYLPKQTDIDKILEVIQRKVLKGTHLPVKIKQKREGIYTVHVSKIYTCICHKINCLPLKWQLKGWRHLQKNIFYWTHYSKLTQKRKQQFLQYQSHAWTRL